MPGDTILLLAGTREASDLARRVRAERPASRLVVSLAGRTKAPVLPAGETRVGGFGGATGLAAFLRAEGVARLVDATHPFASIISQNAATACEEVGIPRIVLLRPAWTPGPDDLWRTVPGLEAARDALPAGARPFLALGSGHVAPFRKRPDLGIVLRMIDAPAEPLPFQARLVLGRPPADWQEEATLFRETGVTHLVCRNSGGALSYPKLAAARALRLPVVMIARPPGPPEPVAADADAVMAWLSEEG